MDIDIRIRGGAVYTPAGLQNVDIAIKGERIAALLDPEDGSPAATEIDATGKHVLPGVVDLHAHTRVPGYEYKEDYRTASEAAAVGGVTTFTDMPNVEPPTDTVELFEEKRAIADRDCLIDYGHLVSPTKPDQVAKLAEAGATGFKVFQVSGGYPHDPRLAMGDTEKLYDAFLEIAKTGLHCSIHPYNQPLMDRLSERAWEAGKPRDVTTFAPIYVADVVWRSAVAVLIELVQETGVRLHTLHTHAAGSIALLRGAKARGLPMTAAVDLKYYHLNRADAEAQGPRAAPGGVITEDAPRLEAIWRALNDGTIDVVDSDHAPHTLEDLERFTADPWTGPFGSPQYEYMLAVTLTDVVEGKLTLGAAMRLLTENSARLVGLWPRKGAIQVGSDADVVIVDLERETVASDEATYTKCGWTPYAGRRLRGVPELTMLRGTIIAKDGKPVGKPGFGRYVEGVPQEVIPVPGGDGSPGLSLRPRADALTSVS
jgi:dihydroorotase